jgi:DNA-binding transcriptional MerR regulator
MTEREKITHITITVAAHRSGVTSRTVRRYVRQGLVSETLTEADLAELRRIRRLTSLGVNLAGVEIIRVWLKIVEASVLMLPPELSV